VVGSALFGGTLSRPLRLAIHVLFLLSGATALVYQVTWLRDLSLVFGASFEATSIVLAAFMAGLSAGGFVFARRSERIRSALAVYGALELGIAGFALIVPALLRALDAAYVAVALQAGGVTPGLNVLRVVMALAILFVPTFLMGGTLPLLARGLVDRFGDFGVRLSWLYGINTLGAVVGAVAAGFVLIPALGVWHSQVLAAAVNVVIGLAAIAGSRRADRAAAGSAPPDLRVPELTPRERRAVELAYWGTAVSGMCALALEVLWTRGIAIAVGTTTYSFTVMLAAFLTGIWLGSWLHALLPLRRLSTAMQFGLAMCAIGLSSSLASFWIPRLPELAVPLNLELYGPLPRIRGGTGLLLGFLVMLVPCLFMGIAFPLAGEARALLGRGFGRSAGDALGLNTLGSIVGSLLAGFAIIPAMGLQRGMLAVAALYTLYGCLVVGVAAPAGTRRRWVVVASASLAALALALPIAVKPWNVDVLGAFQNTQIRFYLGAGDEPDVRARMKGWTVLYYREGRVSTVSVVDQGWDRTLIVNGKAVASDDPVDAHIQLLLGHVPVLMHPDPKSAIVVGMGTGITLGSVAAHPGLERIVLAEIEPAILDARPFFAEVNGDPLGDPRLRVEIQDGRNFLKTTDERFDVITADPIHPFTRGSAYLYTEEYYRIARERLTENGVMCQWLPITALSSDDVRSVIGTFAKVFPYTSLWQSSHDTLLIGSVAPLEIDWDDLVNRLGEPAVRDQLASIGLDDPYAYLAELGLDDAAVRSYTEGAVINTDDNLFLEFSSPLHIGSEAVTRIARHVARARRGLVATGSSPLHAPTAEQLERLAEYRGAKSETVLARLAPSGDVERLAAVVRELPSYRPARIHLARRLARRGSRELEAGRPEAALRSAEAALEADPNEPSAHLMLGAALARLGEQDSAVEAIEQALVLRPNRWMGHFVLAEALARAGRRDEAIAEMRRAIALNPPHRTLADALARLESAEPTGQEPMR
jgi:spermidine synthase